MSNNLSKDCGLLELGIVKDHLPEKDFLGRGVCYRARAAGAVVDTLILHSSYVTEPLAHRPGSGLPERCTEQDARDLCERWQAARAECTATPDPLTRAELQQHAEALEFDALHLLIRARRGPQGLAPYSKDGAKDIFQFYGVSAHYVLDREGGIFELVPPEQLAFHAGKGKMPRPEDGRESINEFSIGIELLGTKQSGYTDGQYQSLARLTRALWASYPLRSFYGHCHISPGRKTDPDCLDWARYKTDIGFDEALHFGP